MPPLPRTSRSSYRSCSFVRLDVMSPPDRPVTLPDASKMRVRLAIVRSGPLPRYQRLYPTTSNGFSILFAQMYVYLRIWMFTLFDGRQIATPGRRAAECDNGSRGDRTKGRRQSGKGPVIRIAGSAADPRPRPAVPGRAPPALP